MPAIEIYANGSGSRSSVPIIEDHLPVTISTVNTKLIFTIDIDTNPNANRKIIYGKSVCTIPRAVPEKTIANVKYDLLLSRQYGHNTVY